MRIDLHTHFLPPEWEDWGAKYGGNRWPRLEHCDACSANMMVGDRLFRRVTDQCWSPERRMEAMDRLGIGMQVISPVPVMLCYWAEPEPCRAFARLQNEYCAKIVSDHPGRFRGMATVPLQDTGLAIDELRHAVEKLGFRAVEIGSFPGGRELDSPEVFPFFEACRDLDVSVFVHPADAVIGKERMGDYYMPNISGNPLETAHAITRFIFGGVPERLPGLRVCFAHGGGAFPYILARVAHGWTVREEPKANIARSPREYARELWYDSLVLAPENLHFLIGQVGDDRVTIGTDYPFRLGEEDPVRFLDSCALDPAVQKKIETGNALAFLGIGGRGAGARR
jgi:aminocarboxymuconate-semialdehyde decarboxylase